MEKICLNCNKSFNRRSQAKYCDRKCQDKYYAKTRADQRNERAKRYYQKNSEQILLKKKLKTKIFVTKSCQNCNNKFFTSSQTKYCSKTCRDKYYLEKYRIKHNESSKIYYRENKELILAKSKQKTLEKCKMQNKLIIITIDNQIEIF